MSKLKLSLYFFSIIVICKSYSQKQLDIIPNNNLRVEVGLISTQLKLEHKLNERITFVPSVGMGVGFAKGRSIFGEEYTEFAFYPTLTSDIRYYLTMQNTNRKGKINKEFGGAYFAFGTALIFNSIQKQKYLDKRGLYGISISIGKQVLKQNGWAFNYFIGYGLWRRYLDGNNLPSNFGFGINIGKSL